MTVSHPAGLTTAPTRTHPPRTGTVAHRTATTARRTAAWLTGPALIATTRTARRARSATLQTSGLASIAYAAYTLHPTAGYATAGVACILLEWVLRPTDDGPAR